MTTVRWPNSSPQSPTDLVRVAARPRWASRNSTLVGSTITGRPKHPCAQQRSRGADDGERTTVERVTVERVTGFEPATLTLAL
jgi:hypothetical protein